MRRPFSRLVSFLIIPRNSRRLSSSVCPFHDVYGAFDAAQRIADLMRQTGGKLTHGGKPVCTP